MIQIEIQIQSKVRGMADCGTARQAAMRTKGYGHVRLLKQARVLAVQRTAEHAHDAAILLQNAQHLFGGRARRVGK